MKPAAGVAALLLGGLLAGCGLNTAHPNFDPPQSIPAATSAAPSIAPSVSPAGTRSTPATSTPRATALPGGPLGGTLPTDIAARQGTVAADVVDLATGQEWRLGADSPVYTASILKVAVLASVLNLDERRHAQPTAADRAAAAAMITQSDNDATTTLWREQGAAAGLTALFARLGMTHTTAATTLLEPWDGVRTTAADQVRLLRVLADTAVVVDGADRSYLLGLMRRVTPSQRWGVTAGVPAGATVAVKNGWVPVPGDGWTVNSIGVVQAGRRAYAIAVTTHGDPTEAYGIATIETVSRHVAAALATG